MSLFGLGQFLPLELAFRIELDPKSFFNDGIKARPISIHGLLMLAPY